MPKAVTHNVHHRSNFKLPGCTHNFQAYYFPALGSTLDQRYLSLGYAFLGKEPDSELACDDPTCEVVVDKQDIIRINCGHTFHGGCFFTENSDQEHSYAFPGDEIKCTVCFEPLCKMIEELTTSLNRLIFLIALHVQLLH